MDGESVENFANFVIKLTTKKATEEEAEEDEVRTSEKAR